jgi:hypothetical protein
MILSISGSSDIKVSGWLTPSFDSLPEKDIQVIVEYLQSMAGHKKPGAVCP